MTALARPNDNTVDDDIIFDLRFAAAVLRELVRLTAELQTRIDAGEQLPAITTIQGIMARANELAECCNRQLCRGLAATSSAVEHHGMYL